MLQCSQCGEDFTLISKVGKPRRKCYKCSPVRPNQHKRHLTRAAGQQVAGSDGVHCPWCGAYPGANSQVFPFCNPAHRRFFADRVADAQDERRIRLAKGPTK